MNPAWDPPQDQQQQQQHSIPADMSHAPPPSAAAATIASSVMAPTAIPEHQHHPHHHLQGHGNHQLHHHLHSNALNNNMLIPNRQDLLRHHHQQQQTHQQRQQQDTLPPNLPTATAASPATTVYSGTDLAGNDLAGYRRPSSSLTAASTVGTSVPGSTGSRHLSISPIDASFSPNVQCLPPPPPPPPAQHQQDEQQQGQQFQNNISSNPPSADPSQDSAPSFPDPDHLQAWVNSALPAAMSTMMDVNSDGNGNSNNGTHPFPHFNNLHNMMGEFNPGNNTGLPTAAVSTASAGQQGQGSESDTTHLTLPKSAPRMVRHLSAQEGQQGNRRNPHGYHPYAPNSKIPQHRRSTGNAIGLTHMQPAPSLDAADLQGFPGFEFYGANFMAPAAPAGGLGDNGYAIGMTAPAPFPAAPMMNNQGGFYMPIQARPEDFVTAPPPMGFTLPNGMVHPAAAAAAAAGFASADTSPYQPSLPLSREVQPTAYQSFDGCNAARSDDPDATLVDSSFVSNASSSSSGGAYGYSTALPKPLSFVKKDMKIPALPTQDFTTEAARWKAVQNRTHVADAFFVCAHLGTRVFCRPSCVAKKPERLRTTYFAFPGAIEAAEAAGFRPCKRCKPEIPGTADNSAIAVGQCIKQIVHETDQVLSGAALPLNDEGEMKNKTLKEYSKLAGLSPFHFHRCFKAVAAITPGEFVRAHTALTLQDRLGMDSHIVPLSPPQVEQTTLGWTMRRARKTLGGALPTMYAQGCPDMDVQAIHADTTAGKVAFAYVEFGLDVGPPVMLACLLGEDAVLRVTKRFPHIKLREDATSWLKGVVDEVMKNAGREVQLPDECVGHVRRARIAVAIRDELEAAVARHRAEQALASKAAASSTSNTLSVPASIA